MTQIRPIDLALFLLAAGEAMPRQRARDQQADIAGLDLKRRVLNMLIARDPEPEELDAALLDIVAEIGPPDGPTRAICTTVRDDWEAAAGTPGLVEWLIEQAVREGEGRPRRKGRRAASDERGTTNEERRE
jgi:hypothetical protein